LGIETDIERRKQDYFEYCLKDSNKDIKLWKEELKKDAYPHKNTSNTKKFKISLFKRIQNKFWLSIVEIAST